MQTLMFQSLLYWIRPSDYIDVEPDTAPNVGFNPCCIGLGLQTILQAQFSVALHGVSILVVLD